MTEILPFAFHPQILNVEPVGRAFRLHLDRLRGKELKEEEERHEEEELIFDDMDLRTVRDISGLDYYEILGLGKVKFNATADNIKQAYRRALLLYHPDKTGRDNEDALFITVQTAYETLSDIKKKQAYDSTIDFDESIPSENQEGDFFEIYRSVFRTNLRFAVKKPAPDLGDMNTPMEAVHRFYRYWTQFESWRDFSLEAAEHDLETAMDRQERRWMERQNKKIEKELKTKEMRRVSTLVERAYAKDPRILNEKLKIQEEKQRELEQKEKERQIKEEEEKRRLEEERLQKEEEERILKEAKKAEKSQREEMKKALRKAKNRLKELFQIANDRSGKDYYIDQDEMDEFARRKGAEGIQKLSEVFGDENDIRIEGLDIVMNAVKQMKIDVAQEEVQRKKDKAELKRQEEEKQNQVSKKTSREWTAEETSMLAKAVVRFPAGSANRWITIANYLNQQLRLTEPKTTKECLDMYQKISTAPLQPIGHQQQTPPQVQPQPQQKAQKEPQQPQPQPPQQQQQQQQSSKPQENESQAKIQEDIWTQQQQKQLEEGLKKYPASMDPNERWKSIASCVEGKTKKQCIERFKTIRSAMQEKKQTKS